MEIKSNWKKYNFSVPDLYDLTVSHNFNFYTKKELKEYINMSIFAHDCVSSYLDENPEIAKKYRINYFYYNILKLANPELNKKIIEWAKSHKIKYIKHKEKVKNYSHIKIP
jgi:hypothetical protein